MNEKYVCIKLVIINDDRESLVEEYKNKFIIGDTYEFIRIKYNNYVYIHPYTEGQYLLKQELEEFFLSKEDYRELRLNQIIN